VNNKKPPINATVIDLKNMPKCVFVTNTETNNDKTHWQKSGYIG
jgi:hypothetical protein